MLFKVARWGEFFLIYQLSEKYIGIYQTEFDGNCDGRRDGDAVLAVGHG